MCWVIALVIYVPLLLVAYLTSSVALYLNVAGINLHRIVVTAASVIFAWQCARMHLSDQHGNSKPTLRGLLNGNDVGVGSTKEMLLFMGVVVGLTFTSFPPSRVAVFTMTIILLYVGVIWQRGEAAKTRMDELTTLYNTRPAR